MRRATAIAIAALILSLASLSACGGRTASPTPPPPRPEGGGNAMNLHSPAFQDRGAIPLKYAGVRVPGGENLSIPYEWTIAPEAKSYALTLVDLHPIARGFVHWIVVDIPPGVDSIAEGASGRAMPPGAVETENTAGRVGYVGPSPPAGSGPHEYRATVYALDVANLGVRPSATAQEVFQALKGHVLAEGSYSGFFEQ